MQSTFLEGINGKYRALVSVADNHPQNAIVKTTLSKAGWQICQMRGAYSVTRPGASIAAIQAVCKEIRNAYGI